MHPCSWFRHTKFSSFQRQLNIYGFRLIPEGRDKGSYYHEHFVRGQYERTMQIERNAIKGTRVRQPNNEAMHPNFYNPSRGIVVGNNPPPFAPAAASPVSSITDRGPSNPQQLPIAPPLTLQNITALSSTFPSENQQQMILALQAIRSSANPSDNGRLISNISMNEQLRDIIQQPVALTSSSVLPTIQPPLNQSPLGQILNQNSLETLLLQQIIPPRPLTVEQMIQSQALMNSLQQQLHNPNLVPQMAGEILINPYNNNSPAVNAELLEQLRRQFFPDGTGL